MLLQELLADLPHRILSGTPETEVFGIEIDNRKSLTDKLFVCQTGSRFDSHTLVPLLKENGVRAVVVERELPAVEGLTMVLVSDTRKALPLLASAFYGHPSRSLRCYGITGSKGKTTVSAMVYSILRKAGKKVACIGTNGIQYEGRHEELQNTTPDALSLQKTMRELLDHGIEDLVLEVSSQSVLMHRIDGCFFRSSVFLNLSEGDHISPIEHPTFENYMECKAALLNRSEKGYLWAEDPHKDAIIGCLEKPPILYGRSTSLPYYVKEESFHSDENHPTTHFTVGGGFEGEYTVPLPGEFTVWNAFAAILLAKDAGATDEAIQAGLSDLSIKGRMELIYNTKRLKVCIDFAHNGQSTENLLKALRMYEPKRLVSVFGADGDRSMDRRIGMGRASGAYADLSIITSGHNRSEEFETILDGVLIGLKPTGGKYIAIKNRVEALRHAISHSEEGDLVAVLGLGHESWQEEKGVKHPYNDEETCKQILKEWEEGGFLPFEEKL